jgi:hypothetical protein
MLIARRLNSMAASNKALQLTAGWHASQVSFLRGLNADRALPGQLRR